MKNFDIEKLERKNIYKTPENFFERMQENVLKETVHKEHKIIPLEVQPKKKFNWTYAAAAVIALIFGSLFVFNQSVTKENTIQEIDRQIANSIKKEVPTMTSSEKAIEEQQNTEKTVATTPVNNHFVTNDNTDAKVVETKIQAKQVKTERVNLPEPKVKKTMSTEERMDLILDVLSDDDIAALAQNIENDIYLDLYQ